MTTISSFDLVVIASSGGKGSQAMLDYLVHLADEEGVPRDRLVVLHTHMGKMDWPGVPELVQEHADHYGVRCVITEPEDDLVALSLRDGFWPTPRKRRCTRDLKTTPTGKAIRKMAFWTKAWVRSRSARIVHCLGQRRETSGSDREVISRVKGWSSRDREVYRWLPIYEWSTQEVWARIHAAGTSHHPAYDLGIPRLECAFCVYAPREAHLLAGEHNPALLYRHLEAEAALGPFQHDQSLAEVSEALNAGERAGKVPDWRM